MDVGSQTSYMTGLTYRQSYKHDHTLSIHSYIPLSLDIIQTKNERILSAKVVVVVGWGGKVVVEYIPSIHGGWKI